MYDYNDGPYGSLDGVTMLKKDNRFFKYRELFPSVLTLALFAIFGSPMITGYRMYSDPNVLYWIGRTPVVLLTIPFFLVVGHIIQSFYGKPLFFPLLFMIVPPAMLTTCVGYGLNVPLKGITVRLLSSDCVTFVEKWNIQNAYDTAFTIYNSCADETAKKTNTTAEAVKKDGLVLTECRNYKPEGSEFEKEWAYLQQLEYKENCAGWCYNGEVALWTNNFPANDACSNAAAASLNSKVNFASQRMMLNGLMGFIIGGGTIWLISDSL